MYGDQVRPLFAVRNLEIYFASRATGFVASRPPENQAAKVIVRQAPSAENKIETAAQQILAERVAEQARCSKNGQNCSLADLYSPGNMPAGLLKAHAQLDKAVDTAYSYKDGKDDAARVAFLFGLYQELVHGNEGQTT